MYQDPEGKSHTVFGELLKKNGRHTGTKVGAPSLDGTVITLGTWRSRTGVSSGQRHAEVATVGGRWESK